jgi:hypothetical protein
VSFILSLVRKFNMLDVRHEQQPGRQPATLLTLDEISSMNPMLVTAKIRIDKATQQASVLDVIKLITGQKSNSATKTFCRLTADCRQLRIDGKGKLTPVCDAKTMVEIIWELPGRAAKAFRRQCVHYIVRILGGDASLVGEMRGRADASAASQRDFFIKIPSMNSLLVNAKIRIDEASQRGSVIDVIRLITGVKSAYAGRILSRLDSEMMTRCQKIRINGKGKPTPVCDSETMVQIIWRLPGRAAKELQLMMHARHARSETFSHDLMTSGTGSYEENGIFVHANIASTKPTSEEVERFFHMDIPRPEEAAQDGFVYFVRARDSLNVKIGYSKDPVKRVKGLQTGCPFKLDLEQAFFCTTAFQTEQYLHEELDDHHVAGEWFKLTKEQVMSAFLTQSASPNP